MQINLNDFDTIYTANRDYDGPEGTILKGERFRVVDYEFALSKGEFAAKVIGDDDVMTFKHIDGYMISD